MVVGGGSVAWKLLKVVHIELLEFKLSDSDSGGWCMCWRWLKVLLQK